MRGPRAALREFAYRHVGGSVAVLVYHRVSAQPQDPQMLAVTPDRFAEHAEALAASVPVISLAEVADGIARRRLPRRAVAITFDDGYADNLHVAAPILERVGLPATVFVSSGYAASQAEYWWDELERIVLSPGALPHEIELQVGPSAFSGTPGDSAQYTEAEAKRHAAWDIGLEPPTGRHRLYLELVAYVRSLKPAHREEALARLREMADPSLRVPRTSHLPLSEDEVAELGRRPGIDVGGHTRNHALLAALSEDDQRAEIDGDRTRLGELLGNKPDLFAYPYGGFGDYDVASRRVAAEAGYRLACANFPRPAKPWSDPYVLPRFLVRDWDATTLIGHVEHWLDNGGASS